jgi:hypothetical protein
MIISVHPTNCHDDQGFRICSGNRAIFAAIRRASSLVSSLAAERAQSSSASRFTARFYIPKFIQADFIPSYKG